MRIGRQQAVGAGTGVLGVLAVGAAMLVAGAQTRASQRAVAWTGGSGYWTDASRWTGGVVPNNTADTTYTVWIDNANPAASSVAVFGAEYPPQPSYTVDAITIDAGDALTLGAYANLTALNGVMVNGTLSAPGFEGVLNLGPNQHIAGTGQILFDGDMGGGTIHSTSGSLTIGSGITVRGGGTIGDIANPLINKGTITDGVGLVGSTFDNQGTVQISSGSEVAICTTLSKLSDLGSVTNGGILELSGTIEGAASPFVIDDSYGALRFSGRVHNATVNAAPGQKMILNGDLLVDGATLNAPVIVNDHKLQIPDGGTLAGTAEIQLVNTSSWPGIEGAGSFTIGSGIHITGTYGSWIEAGKKLTNEGRITADGNAYSLGGLAGLENHGIIEAINGGEISLIGKLRTEVLSTLTARDGGTYKLDGTLDNTGDTYTVGVPVDMPLTNGHILGGVVEAPASHPLVIPQYYTGHLDGGVTVNGVVQMQESAWLSVSGGLQGKVDISLSSNCTIISPLGEPLVLGPGVTVKGGSGTVGLSDAPTTIHGKIDAGARQTVELSGSSIAVDGTLALHSGGKMTTRSSLTFGSGGTLYMELAGISQAVLAITGDLDLSVEDDVLKIPPEVGLPSTWFLVATYSGNLIGEFDDVSPGYYVDYTKPHAIYVSTVPEPGSAASVGAVIAMLAARGSRRGRRNGPS